MGEQKKAHVIFVTGEEKADWVSSIGETYSANFDLIEKFANVSEGKHFAVCKFSAFLGLLKADDGTVNDAKRVESVRQVTETVTAIRDVKQVFSRWNPLDITQRRELLSELITALDIVLNRLAAYFNEDRLFLPNQLENYLLPGLITIATEFSQGLQSHPFGDSSSSLPNSEELRRDADLIVTKGQNILQIGRFIRAKANTTSNMSASKTRMDSAAGSFILECEKFRTALLPLASPF